MFIKFKLLEWIKSASNINELNVADCEYESQLVRKVVFDPKKCEFISKKLEKGKNKIFILEAKDPLEGSNLKIEGKDNLLINNSDCSIFSAESNLLFCPQKIEINKGNLEVECTELK